MATAAQNKKLLYVGGLAEEVDEKMLHAAFIPFGDIIGNIHFLDALEVINLFFQTLRYHLTLRPSHTGVLPLSNLKRSPMPPRLEIIWTRLSCLAGR